MHQIILYSLLMYAHQNDEPRMEIFIVEVLSKRADGNITGSTR